MRKEPFKFVYRKEKRCRVCGKVKSMLRMQKMCDDCRHRLGKDIPRVPRGAVSYDI